MTRQQFLPAFPALDAPSSSSSPMSHSPENSCDNILDSNGLRKDTGGSVSSYPSFSLHNRPSLSSFFHKKHFASLNSDLDHASDNTMCSQPDRQQPGYRIHKSLPAIPDVDPLNSSYVSLRDGDRHQQQPSSSSTTRTGLASLDLNLEDSPSLSDDLGFFLSSSSSSSSFSYPANSTQAPKRAASSASLLSPTLQLKKDSCTTHLAVSTLVADATTTTTAFCPTTSPLLPSSTSGVGLKSDSGHSSDHVDLLSTPAQYSKMPSGTPATAPQLPSPPSKALAHPLPSHPLSPPIQDHCSNALPPLPSLAMMTNPRALCNPHTTAYPSPPLPPTEITESPVQELKPNFQETLMTPSMSHNSMASECAASLSVSRVSLNDIDPALSQPSTQSSLPDEGSQRGYQLKDEPATVSPGTLVRAITPVQISDADASLHPVHQKSEDWGALVDTPASPIHSHHPGMMVLGGESYVDSFAPEDATADYLQYVSHPSYIHQPYPHPYSYQSNEDPALQRPYLIHANTDPMGMHHNLPYQHHQHHNSSPSDPLPQGGSSDVINEIKNVTTSRRSWSASDVLNGTGPSAHGYLTPPRHASDANGWSRPHSGIKQGSVATSVSLLTDAAILAKYRETAIKTNDVSIQLSYAKYLLELGDTSLLGSSPSSSPESTSRPSSAQSNPNSSSPPPSPTSQDPQMGKKQLTIEAIYWIDRLAKEGQPEAQFMKGTWYEDGSHGSKRNLDKALRWFQSASKGDYGPAHYKVGFYCEKKKDNNKAVMLYKKAAIHNDVPANHRLAIIYLYGELGQSKNMKAGLQYLKRAASFATENAPMSPYVLGLILSRDYNEQLVVPDDIAFPDDGEAFEWFRKSAQLGYGPANYKLGYCYEYGSLGCPIDPFLSVQHYERAVRAGDSNGEAEMALSGWYLSGAENLFLADDQLAFSYAAKAAEKKLAKAQYAMGYYHEVGIATEIDATKAMEFYNLAAANGNKDAKKRLEEKAASYDKLGHKNSIRRIKQGRKSKDNSCAIM